MARLTLDEVLASDFDCDDDSDNFGHLSVKLKRRKMKECLPIQGCRKHLESGEALKPHTHSHTLSGHCN